ncbi:MAG: ATP synthase F1 subunit delta [Gammaproteobacteria bacterium RIFCSPHIGHO2_12_FULL_43_28]|nr:MAG: ATP synthase F1 subunit delta [Gammaproteobacteria bacterium RIFCSPHIGHO2_12_FULL_43_28]
MANASNQQYAHLARPYALAAFQFALEKEQLPAWKVFLNTAALVASDTQTLKLLKNPATSVTVLHDLFREVLAPLNVSAEQQNFLALLAQHQRFMILPEIAELFNVNYAQLEKISKIRLITAVEAEQGYKQHLAQILAKRVQREVTLSCEVDPSIIGGAIIHIGDRVIDGSVRRKLTRLLQNLAG